ncbi:MAG: hypothetical protein M3258_00385 [Thermoproteota archaeon]|nr:hypothetical protein [Thermoproteota archaeon]
MKLLAIGMNQSWIARELKLPKQTIPDDVKVLREESKERLRTQKNGYH